MNDHFNELTPTEAELVALLLEECGEVVQVCGKVLRHGLRSTHPRGGRDNRALLEKEMGDVLTAARVLAEAGILRMDDIERAARGKRRKVDRYLHHYNVESAT